MQGESLRYQLVGLLIVRQEEQMKTFVNPTFPPAMNITAFSAHGLQTI